ncbi:winged helix DNA-binding protein [Nonomuraea phyllanthi]|uniref:MarR family winged helix-turn-helix transcriptional regulator n=1 Tax=Nonomuraea phyllanthi TaxID=2219224 RepID=UPI00129416A6|nr:winged helix DNA-binding protein [Nonomuraea phyllanthi]QFY07851.1 winged helix DNA-binding protein [Nonomuraea phyllanthi]
MTTATPTALNPQILGQAENAHRALLERALTGTGLTYRHWVTLKIAAAGGQTVQQQQLAGQVAGALKIDAQAAGESIARLTAAGLLEVRSGTAGLTAQGHDLHQRLSTAIGQTISQLYSAVSPEDLQVAGRVLAAITARADAELATA